MELAHLYLACHVYCEKMKDSISVHELSICKVEHIMLKGGDDGFMFNIMQPLSKGVRAMVTVILEMMGYGMGAEIPSLLMHNVFCWIQSIIMIAHFA